MTVERWLKPVVQQALKLFREVGFTVEKSSGTYKVIAPNGDLVLTALNGTKDYLVRYDSSYISWR